MTEYHVTVQLDIHGFTIDEARHKAIKWLDGLRNIGVAVPFRIINATSADRATPPLSEGMAYGSGGGAGNYSSATAAAGSCASAAREPPPMVPHITLPQGTESVRLEIGRGYAKFTLDPKDDE